MKIRSLIEVKEGNSAVIDSIDSALGNTKLQELGFIKGTIIRTIHVSFNRQTFCFAINNGMFALRRSDAESIKVIIEKG